MIIVFNTNGGCDLPMFYWFWKNLYILSKGADKRSILQSVPKHGVLRRGNL